ncbi:sigma-70 family RNA polymerase sigma factor [Flavivirga sp. MEBiC05379]|uniref:Sigma-70 family RNA polymerase sigma factor n=1 Tax=Flavivirga spongiicola TaxID=421621 RepID=A0ABU7XPJ0_9FLAO|nr:sigma-70 family RNA polymerase sigma factor [Flavivirga sp. MEBiC05379]MDO5977456.1 sigma-70 family RNA polymerase sigma factor [Flavivirga sp. MEBiC05379]
MNTSAKNNLKEVFDTYYEALVLYANRFLSLKDECEDIVQDIFADLWEKDLTFPDDLSLKVYLYKSTRNKCYNIIKHNKVKDLYSANYIQLLEDDNLFLKQILEEEIVRQLNSIIEILPKRKKEIIKLSLRGIKNKEISEIIGIKLQTVKTLKSQSYKILREEFKELKTIINFLLFKKKKYS